MQPNKLPPNFVPGGQPQGGDDRARQAAQMITQMQQRVRDQMEQEQLIKPSSQVVGDEEIVWNWNIPGSGHVLQANFYRGNKQYVISLIQTIEAPMITSEDAIVIGNALRSAGIWKNLWKQHLGELMFPEEKPGLDNFHPKEYEAMGNHDA